MLLPFPIMCHLNDIGQISTLLQIPLTGGHPLREGIE
jgi:hypothetical protein